jgi:hypothetical protein
MNEGRSNTLAALTNARRNNNTTRKMNNSAERGFIQEVKAMIETNAGAYRFLYTEPKSLNSHYYFVGLNPGGTEVDNSDLFIESGNAILNENWAGERGKNPLQNQMMYFFEDMAKVLDNTGDWIPYMNTQWMITNFVFYKSPAWKTMASKRDHIKTCKEVWRKIFTRNVPKIIVANGYETQGYMVALLEEFGWETIDERRSCGPWNGPHIIIMKQGEKRCITVGFAHLSRFGIIRRKENKECLEKLYALMKEFK